WVTGCSAAVVEDARQLMPEIIPRSSIIYNGLEAPPVLPEPIPSNPPRVLCLGRLSYEKGFDFALTAFATAVTQFPRARLMVAGDGPERTALERQALQLGIRHAVDFLGAVTPDTVPSLLNRASLVLMPSRTEGLPLVAVEAALMARPVVATRVGGLPEVVVHRHTGLLVDKEDCQGLAEAITFVLEHPQAVAHMGQAARRRAQAVFSLERCVAAYDALYRTLAREGAASGPAHIP
ncbi:MAG TPA: glycosyltransferase family 4 protein, partial [Candidatus Binatia bacterium]|nr:glycosyltransferase family 4 protein [Candidatus Binatia bacterium]